MSITQVIYSYEIVRCRTCDTSARKHALANDRQLLLQWELPFPVRVGSAGGQAFHNCQVCGAIEHGGVTVRTVDSFSMDRNTIVRMDAGIDRPPQRGQSLSEAMTHLDADDLKTAISPGWWNVPVGWLKARRAAERDARAIWIAAKICHHCDRRVLDARGPRLIDLGSIPKANGFGMAWCDGCGEELPADDAWWLSVPSSAE